MFDRTVRRAPARPRTIVGRVATPRRVGGRTGDRTAATNAGHPPQALLSFVGGSTRIQRAAEPRPAAVTGLAPHLRRRLERASGLDMGDVRVHYDSPDPDRVQALAFTRGSDIHLAPGQERHLPHEAWHVAQQRQGRVAPTIRRRAAAPINDDPALEREADAMARRLTAGGEPGHVDHAGRASSHAATDGVVQRTWSRMSTRLDEADDMEIAHINDLAAADEWFDALWVLVHRFPDLAASLRRIGEFAQRDEIIKQAADRVLGEAFLEPGKAYAAWELIELLEQDPLIGEEIAGHLDEPWLDELIAQFSQLTISIPFRSHVDQGREEHEVSWKQSDVIVASNPKPLKDVLRAGVWENFALQPAIINQLTGLRKTAKLALYGISGHAGRGITGSRTNTKMNALRLALTAIVNVLANLGGAGHAAALMMPPTDLSGSTDHGSNSQPTEGTKVVATKLSMNSATHGSKPKDGRLMTSIRNLAGANRKAYFQMHLLNDLVFGPGELWNLTPGPAKSNGDMERQVEDPLKRAILGKGLVIRFEAEVDYANDPTNATQQQIDQSPDMYRMRHIDFEAEQLEYDATVVGPDKWVVAAHQDPDVAAVNGARIRWNYGNLPPLVPKPRIRNVTNTWKDLNAVGIPPAASKRIVAFIAANPGWTPPSKNKQDALARDVKAWEGSKRVPDMKWDANSVYWT